MIIPSEETASLLHGEHHIPFEKAGSILLESRRTDSLLHRYGHGTGESSYFLNRFLNSLLFINPLTLCSQWLSHLNSFMQIGNAFPISILRLSFFGTAVNKSDTIDFQLSIVLYSALSLKMYIPLYTFSCSVT